MSESRGKQVSPAADDWPVVRVARKGEECHVLWPGELAGPFKRSGYEIREYAPASTPQKDHA